MPVFKNEDNGTWYVMARYVNWKGERRQKCKRGFATKKEAQEWERMFQLQNASDLDMSFEAFTELYIRDVKTRLKENTWLTKEHIIRTKILPYFGKLRISEISIKEIITWQNELLAYRDEKKKPYSQTYLKTLHNQLSAIFNHAVRYYELRSNPAANAGFSVPGDLRPYGPVFWNAGRPGTQRLCCQPPVILCLDTGIQPEISGFIQRVLPELCQHDEMRGKLLASQYPILDPEAPGRRERRACNGGVCPVDQFQGHS